MQVDRKILGSGIAGVLALLVWGISAAFGHPIPAAIPSSRRSAA